MGSSFVKNVFVSDPLSSDDLHAPKETYSRISVTWGSIFARQMLADDLHAPKEAHRPASFRDLSVGIRATNADKKIISRGGKLV